MSEDRAVEVSIKYKDLEKTIRGDANEVIRELISFLSELSLIHI